MTFGHLSFGIFDLVGVIMLVLAGSSFFYLLLVKNKSSSSSMFQWFFLCVILSSIATIITNIGTSWDWAFAPSQDALLILGGVFLVRFAYLYPQNDQTREARLAVSFFSLIGLAALAYAVGFAFVYIANLPGDLAENQTFYLLTPITIVLTVIVFFRRSIHWSVQSYNASKTEARFKKPVIQFLFKPENRLASALRNYGLALAISLVPVITLVDKMALPPVVASFLFNFGAVIAIAALMLTYFTSAPEQVTLSAKLISISLVSVLLILGLAGVWIYHAIPGLDEHTLVSTLIALVLLSSLLIILVFPYFFRTALLDPLDRLLSGVKIANEGDLSIQVAVQYDDEIGFLTQSFNRMVSTLKQAGTDLQNRAIALEAEVNRRTADLSQTNVRLVNENKERQIAETRLNQQWLYQKALASCSQSLLATVEDEGSQQQVLNQALGHLRSAAQASRAYIVREFDDPELGACIGLVAEVCAPDIPPHINTPINRKFPKSRLQKDFVGTLLEGKPFGGPVKEVFATNPALQEAFLSQIPPLLSVMFFPLYNKNQFWGFIGFDDCITEREWDDRAISMLRTASEMTGNTLQRWQAEKNLRETLDALEQRVVERTIEFTQANAELSHEIHERQHFQRELEERLVIESTLAKISARLLSPIDQERAIQEIMAELGQIMQAKRVALIRMAPDSSQKVVELIEWHNNGEPQLPINQGMKLNETFAWLGRQLEGKKSIFINDLISLPEEAQQERDLLISRDITSLLVTPFFIDQRLAGVIACSNTNLPGPKISENIQSIEVVARMLGSMLHRDELLNTLEERIAERTRELSAFFDMTMLSGEAQEISEVMQAALAKVMEISASVAGSIHLYDPEERVLKLVALRGFPRELQSRYPTDLADESMSAWLESIDEGDNFEVISPTPMPNIFVIPGFQTATYIPLRARGKSQGLLCCYRQEKIAYDPYQISFLNAIGEQLGMAVENYRLRQNAEEAAAIQERQRLARELHDAVSQSLYSLTLFARSGRDAFDSGDQAKLIDSLEQLELSSLAALKEMRLLLYQFRSLALEKGGLVQAIESRFNLVERRSGTEADFSMDETINLPDWIEQELFLLISEALNNALKHASASRVTVSIQPENEHMALVIWNNGRSFDPTQALGGMGLENMRARAAGLGGQFMITSQPESGTWIHVELPRP